MTDEEFEEFYTHSVKHLVGQVYLMTGDLHEAQDVVQEAFVRGWSRRAALERDAGPEAWIRTVAWRLAVSRWRRRGRAAAAWRLRDGGAPAASPAPDPGTVSLVSALRTLPERQRRMAVLHYVCDLSVEQVAAETGISAGTVKTHLFRARAALRPHLVPEEEHGV
ncbi:SigE family RNA polymerase sigma factor [Streptomyces clavuligerus]|uniref:RNA polymerase sigma factor n=1 Tax=Streptomyces clavuligerus TaxID=1901 RepID=B5GPQ1_STRCL|nr:SigE family RNA polymerase sigma factor [Streptomyces clavuligerus]ANW19838.1 RNA polymerase [Streptomyces clavuligerus]AXU14453.1 SigE family RNA polymerase sigma factor [Streptomyces clavuligerus]EDY48297.1 RNA polymerase ECF-subfamily sigma factor [Streptomyces clavuligerus]EFG07301.1 RNA polymerase sigma factor [Streptomyces clavuligerus]MBY6304464.1 SigE family RNA polymerase sigma factor [Streptomyces clavuligerus]